MPSVRDLFKRSAGSVSIPETPPISRPPEFSESGRREIPVQAEVGFRTVGTLTAVTEMREAIVFTESFATVDRTTETDLRSVWDAGVQASVSSMEAGTDPGDWNETVQRGIDSQTDSPDPKDPFFWLSGSSAQLKVVFEQLIAGIEREELESETLRDERDHLQLRAENVLLRVEVETLKRKISQAEGMRGLSTPALDSRRVHRGTVAAVTAGAPFSSSFTVTSEEGLVVTSSLAPSSAPLGRLKPGDKVFTAGAPEEICGLVRGPILPRGWITLRDREHTYLRKSA